MTTPDIDCRIYVANSGYDIFMEFAIWAKRESIVSSAKPGQSPQVAIIRQSKAVSNYYMFYYTSSTLLHSTYHDQDCEIFSISLAQCGVHHSLDTRSSGTLRPTPAPFHHALTTYANVWTPCSSLALQGPLCNIEYGGILPSAVTTLMITVSVLPGYVAPWPVTLTSVVSDAKIIWPPDT